MKKQDPPNMIDNPSVFHQTRVRPPLCRLIGILAFATVFGSCASFGPYHANTTEQPYNSVRSSKDGRYKLAFIEFGDQGSNLDNSQIKAALDTIHQAERPVLFVYIHGWQNNANSGDVCRFEHFLDTISSFRAGTGETINVIGVYIAWRGRDLTFPGLNLLTFYSRKAVAGQIASQVSCLATLDELALAARDPRKKLHRCILIGHSFGGLLLGNTISHSILDASGTGTRNPSPWDMAVTFNSADSSISTRQLLKELDYLYRYDPARHAYVSRASGQEGTAVPENRPFLVFLQSENDSATGKFFPIGTEFYNAIGLRYHWEQVPVPGHPGEKVSEREFYTHTPGNNPYLVNYKVVPLGDANPPPNLRATQNRAFEANLRENHPDYSFYTSEHNDGHEDSYCRNGKYDPDQAHPSTAGELWRRWQFVYTGNARVPCWIVRVPKEIIYEHGGLWSDNSMAMLAALVRIQFPLNAGGTPVSPPLVRMPKMPDLEQ
jgi:hypothetical protein